MRVDSIRPLRRRAILAGVAVLTLAGRLAPAQGPDSGYVDVPRVAQTPQSGYPPIGTPATGTPPVPESAAPAAGAPAAEAYTPQPPAAPSPAGSAYDSALGPEQFASLGGQSIAIGDNAGYIDSAIIRSRFRQRYDSAYDLNAPDRGEFFYAKCGCFSRLPHSDPNFDPRALGPFHAIPKTPIPGRLGLSFPGAARVDYQELTSYLEIAANPRTSGFIEMPVRFLNPSLGKSTYGFSDINLGFKHAFIANPNQFYTFQFRTYVPTGSGELGLGTNHPSLEPALLVFQRLTDRLYFSGEFRDWIPVHGTNFAGNILRYGAGLAYNVVLTQNVRVAPVTEFVGWTVLNGKELVPNPNFTATSDPNDPNAGGIIKSAAGQTIVNGKFGIRIGLGKYDLAGGGSGLNDRQSFYVGYGRALTGEHWYRDMIRVEYNFWF
jgi:hypothetical protein